MSIDQFSSTEFWGQNQYSGILAERINLTLAWLPSQIESVLDVGCGNGLLTNRLSEKTLAVGVDRFYAPLTSLQTHRAQSDILGLPFADGAFDAVVAAEVIEHLPDAIYAHALAEMARVARCYLFISVPFHEKLWLDNVRCPQCGLWFNKNGHMRSYALENLVTLFDAQPAVRPLRIQGIVANNRAALVREARVAWQHATAPERAWASFVACPRCGYSSGSASGPATQGAQVRPAAPAAGGPRASVRRALRSVWPRDRSPRWWAALYAKEE